MEVCSMKHLFLLLNYSLAPERWGWGAGSNESVEMGCQKTEIAKCHKVTKFGVKSL